MFKVIGLSIILLSGIVCMILDVGGKLKHRVIYWLIGVISGIACMVVGLLDV